MEAMSLGKPVIATAWSGNMTFMNHTNSCLVGYKLVPVRGVSLNWYNAKFLGRGSRWADPDMEQAANWMRKLVDTPALRAELGRKASKAIAEFRNEALQGYWVDELNAIALSALTASSHDHKQEKVRALQQALIRHNDSGLARPKRIARQCHRFLDRHLLWRF